MAKFKEAEKSELTFVPVINEKAAKPSPVEVNKNKIFVGRPKQI